MKVDPAFQELYREGFPAVFRAAYAMCGDRSVAEDAAQEAFARALERWARLRGRERVLGWVVTTALNVARRALRRRPEIPSSPRGSVEPDDRMDLVRAIRTLPRRQQEAVVLRYVADLPVAEVAGTMGVEEGTVKAHLARARAALALELGGDRVDG